MTGQRTRARQVVVEGIETVHQEHLARSMGLDRMQGWLYSPAVDVSDLHALLEAPAGRSLDTGP